MKKVVSVLFAILLTVGVAGCGFMYEREYYCDSSIVFGTDLTLDVWLLGKNSPRAFQDMVETLHDIDAEISLTRPDSALSRLNAADVAVPVRVGKHAYALLQLAERYYGETSGAFHAGLHPLSQMWGVDAGASGMFGEVQDTALPDIQNVRAVTQTIAGFQQQTSLAFGVMGYLEDDGYYFQKLDAAATLDFGSIAKGYAADRCVEIATEYALSSAIIDLSGNIVTMGQFREESGQRVPFTVSVTDPRSHGTRGASLKERLFVLSVAQPVQAIVVSGDYERYYWHKSGDVQIPVCHIINPLTGMPLGIYHTDEGYQYDAENTVISVMIATENSALADAYSTAVCVMGYEKGTAFLQQNGIRGAVMTEQKLAFVGICEDDLYRPDEYGTYSRYETIVFLERNA